MSETSKALDQFYTNPLIAERFVKKVDELYDLSSYDHVIEPSMGEGFIYDFLPSENRIGLDIEKNHPDCEQGDFFKWTPEKSGIVYEPLFGEVAKNIFVGNPPFGRASNLATAFFHHAAQYGDAICFIIPRSWMRIGMHNRLPTDFGLYFEAILPDKAFLFNGKKHEVKCVAQCWSRSDPCPDIEGDHKEDWREMPL